MTGYAGDRGLIFPSAADSILEASKRGFIDGFVVKYYDTTNVTITAGALEANGKYYELAADTQFAVGGLGAGYDVHYIYIDDAASSPPTPSFAASITEPTYSPAARGWYGGAGNRCIGAVISPVTGPTITYFNSESDGGKEVRHTVGSTKLLQLATNMNPDGTWQSPNTIETSLILPVNAIAVKLLLYNSDIGSTAILYAASSEMAAVNTSVLDGQINILGYNEAQSWDWVSLGPSRNIKIGGRDDDDNALNAFCVGFKILR